MSEKLENTKYLVIGIDHQTGSLNYIVGDDDKYIDTANKSVPPFNVLQDMGEKPNENMQYVKIKVQKSTSKPVAESTEKQPYFELNNAWYTLILDEAVNQIETSGVVDKKWFGNYALENDPFDIFSNVFYNKKLIIQNIKYLFNLPQSDFNKEFPEINDHKNDPLHIIEQSLVKPFFAIKTVIDMKSSKKVIQPDKTEKIVENYFIIGRDRYGYPNIKGDKSYAIAALQMLYDVRMYCPGCITESEDDEKLLKKLHQHITLRTYFLHESDADANILDFDNDLRTFPSNGETIQKKCLNVLKHFSSKTIGMYEATPLTTPTENMIIVNSETLISKADNYELIGQICKVNGIDHLIYFDNKNGLTYNDVEIREQKDLLYICEKSKFSLYRKKGQTYRDLLKTKFLLTEDDIERTINGNKTINFIDTFVSTTDTYENDEKVKDFIMQYLADKSRFELEVFMRKKPFDGTVVRHGICNHSGDLSYFMAAMQMLYDCVLFTYGKEFTDVGLQKADQTTKMFEFQLLNLEYCLRRIFENIQSSFDNNNNLNFNPLELMTTPIGNEPSENVFHNFMICINFILAANPLFNISLDNAHPGVNPRDPDAFPEYSQDTVMDNYYYKKYVNNFLDYSKIQASITAAGTSAAPTSTPTSDWWYPGKILMKTWNTLQQFNDDDLETSLDEIGADDNEKKNINDKLTPEEKKKAFAELLKTKKIDFNNKSVPDIIRDKCVGIINTLIIVLLRKGNVFVDFEDDLRPVSDKFAHFLEDPLSPSTSSSSVASGVRKKVPNFIIKIGSLPRKPLETAIPAPATAPATSSATGAATASAPATAPATGAATTAPAPAPPPAPVKNWIKITGGDDNNLNIEYLRGVYFPEGPNYKHSEHNDVIMELNGGIWEIRNGIHATTKTKQIFAKSAGSDILKDTWTIKELIYNDTTTNTFNPAGTPVSVTEIGAPYIPSPGEKIPDFTPTVSSFPEKYQLNDALFTVNSYTRIGQIYKSIYHDLYYKYYNEPSNTLFFDFTAINVNSQKEFQQNTRNMFPFIALYKNDLYNAVEIEAAAGPAGSRENFIYQDIVEWINYLQNNLKTKYY